MHPHTSAHCVARRNAPFFRLSVPVGKKSDRRRVWHFMERERRPRERHDPEGRRVWDFTYNHEAAGSDVLLKPGFSSSSAQPSRTLNPVAIAKPGTERSNLMYGFDGALVLLRSICYISFFLEKFVRCPCFSGWLVCFSLSHLVGLVVFSGRSHRYCWLVYPSSKNGPNLSTKFPHKKKSPHGFDHCETAFLHFMDLRKNSHTSKTQHCLFTRCRHQVVQYWCLTCSCEGSAQRAAQPQEFVSQPLPRAVKCSTSTERWDFARG